MSGTRISNCFNKNLILLKIFGLWQGRTPSKYYKYFSIPYLFITYIVYNTLLALNLIYTPVTVELFIPEVIFLCTELAMAGKVFMILFKRKQILEAFDLLDCDFFKCDDDTSTIIVQDNIKTYSLCFNILAILCHFDYFIMFIMPVFFFKSAGGIRVLPICKYYFASDEIRNDYFAYFYFYQAFGIYDHMMYNVCTDSFVSGMILMAITQSKVIKHKFHKLKLDITEKKYSRNVQEQIMYSKLVECLKHYDQYLKYCSKLQEITSLAMFLQFGLGASVICVVLCGLILLPSSIESTLFMIFFQTVIVGEIFLPAWLGTQLNFENRELAFAAYNSDWITSSEKFKRSLRLFVERTNVPMVLTGYKMFPLSLGTFLSIMKFSYSSFTLVRKIQEQNGI